MIVVILKKVYLMYLYYTYLVGKGLEFETWLLNAIASERRQRMEENRRVKESLEQS